MKIDIKDCDLQEQLFHNETIPVCPQKIPFESINFWPENLRTLLDFDLLKSKRGVDKITDLELEEITHFLSKKDELALPKLAKNILMNGVRVPLIITSNGRLLDGNRRYFACSILFHRYKKENKELPEVLKNIPVWIVTNLKGNQERKILAETNFVKDLKVPWSLDVKAKLIFDTYQELVAKGISKEDAYAEIEDIYSLDKQETKSYIDTIKLTQEFLGLAKGEREREFKLREVLAKKFVYFWEFRNKAFSGSAKLDDEELAEVQPEFFTMMELGRFKNMKQIEPMIRAHRDDDLWTMLKESSGLKINEVVFYYNEQKTIKSAEDKVRNFLKWVKKSQDKTFSKPTYRLLEELKREIDHLIESKPE